MPRTAPLIASLLLLAGTAAAQDRDALLAAARDQIGRAPFATLITLGPDGHPQARVVDAWPPKEDFTVWIGTRRPTRKVAQIREDPRVTLFWMDPAGSGYVTLFGTAELVDDPDSRAAHWKAEWEAFYDDAWRGDDFVLVRVRPLRLEVLDYTAGVNGDPDTWQPAGVDF